jgi:integral membrane protein
MDRVKQVNRFRKIGIAEGISFLVLLFIAMPMKYMAGIPELVKYVGWAHGVLFVAYVGQLIVAAFLMKWSIERVILFFALSLIPFGTFYVEKKLKTEQTAV